MIHPSIHEMTYETMQSELRHVLDFGFEAIMDDCGEVESKSEKLI